MELPAREIDDRPQDTCAVGKPVRECVASVYRRLKYDRLIHRYPNINWYVDHPVSWTLDSSMNLDTANLWWKVGKPSEGNGPAYVVGSVSLLSRAICMLPTLGTRELSRSVPFGFRNWKISDTMLERFTAVLKQTVSVESRVYNQLQDEWLGRSPAGRTSKNYPRLGGSRGCVLRIANLARGSKLIVVLRPGY